jgi:hypothetical protein
MKAIETVYLGPGNVKGARIKARDCDANSVTIDYPHELGGMGNTEACHAQAAIALCKKMGWRGPLIGGASVGSGYVFVFADGDWYDVEAGGKMDRDALSKRVRDFQAQHVVSSDCGGPDCDLCDLFREIKRAM